jgi:hypothetical protein
MRHDISTRAFRVNADASFVFGPDAVMLNAMAGAGIILGLTLSIVATAEAPLLLLQGPDGPVAELLDAESLRAALELEIPADSLRIRLDEPRPAADLRRYLSAVAEKTGARAALAIEAAPAKDCFAPCRLRLLLYDSASGRLLERELCPGASRGPLLARAVALSVADVLRQGWLEGVRIGERRPPIPERDGAPSPGAQATASEPPPAVPGTGRSAPVLSRWRLEAGAAFSSQPAWEDPGLGPMVRLWLLLSDRFWAGLSFAASRERTMERPGLLATWSSWPLSLQFRLRLGGQRLKLFWQGGFFLAFTDLSAMLVEESQPRLARRRDPGFSSHAAVLIRLWPGLWLGLEAGPALYLLRQRYSWGDGENRGAVLSMTPVALEAGLFLSAGAGEEAP